MVYPDDEYMFEKREVFMWSQRLYNKEVFDSLVGEGLSDVFSTIIANRNNGIADKEGAGKYAERSMKHFAKPYETAGMQKAVEVVKKAATENSTVAIFGDYDVDGITSATICTFLLQELNCTVCTYLPERIGDGYGLNDTSVLNFIKMMDDSKLTPDLVMVLDCGTSSDPQIKLIKAKWNCKVVVVDHHIADEKTLSISADALVNPRMNDSHPFCTAGLAFQLARAILGKKISDRYAAYAAIGTVADVCMMQGSNRILVHNGIEALKKLEDPGLAALLSACSIKVDKMDEDTIGFVIGPVLNSSGRLTSPMQSYNLLIAGDRVRANDLAMKLVALNERRKEEQKKIMDSVELHVARSNRSSIVAIGEWHTGIVGIVAGHLSEKYGKPVLCFGKDENGKIAGSGRSRAGIHIKEAMDDCSEMFLRYGGHELAAGATLKPEYADKAADLFDTAVKKQMERTNYKVTGPYFDVLLTTAQFRMVNNAFCERLARIGPFGQENHKPVFRVDGVTCKLAAAWASNKGGNVILSENDMDTFAMVPDIDKKLHGRRLDILFTVERSFKDAHIWSLKIQHARLAGAS
jgi:single-stranded-DNA-specific exonuclease